MHKKLLTLLMTLLMIISAMPVAVFATTETHSHPICGNDCVCSSYSHADVQWTAWNGKTTLYDGYYYLTEDIVLSSTKILNYSYNTTLCLNGHSITCNETVFDVYSNRTFAITDCAGTGTVETTGEGDTICNARSLTIWNGTIKNSSDHGDAISVGKYDISPVVNIYGGKIEGHNGIHQNTDTRVNIYGGTVYGKYAGVYMQAAAALNVYDGMIQGDVVGVDSLGNTNISTATLVNVSGGTIISNATSGYKSAISITAGRVIISGGYMDGIVSASGGFVNTISGGTIAGNLSVDGTSSTISGGKFQGEVSLSNGFSITGGVFEGNLNLGASYRDSDVFSISGGEFNYIKAKGGCLYLSGEPSVETLEIYSTCSVSAQNSTGFKNYTGNSINVKLYDYNESTWEYGDVVIKNVSSDDIAKKFVYPNAHEWNFIDYDGNNLILRKGHYGTCGSDTNWGFMNGTLTIYGEGSVDWTGWSFYASEITAVVIKRGITKFNNRFCFHSQDTCSCTSITDVYFSGTESEWGLIEFTYDETKALLENARMHYDYCTVNANSKHSYTSKITTPATHLTEGVMTCTCSACGESYTKKIEKTTKHTYSAVITAPTCTEKGYTTYVCECGNSYIADYTDKIKHNYTAEITTPATHLTEGVETFTCHCGDSYTKAVAKLPEHTYTSAVTKEATHLEEGIRTFTCACGDTYTEIISRITEHKYNAVVTAPTCTEKGYTTYTCECTYTYVADYVNATGHSYKGVVTTPATHLTEGVMTYTCKCGNSSYTEIIPTIAEHSYNSFVETEPTCTAKGLRVFECECGYTYSESIPATGHKDKNGDIVCDRCGEHFCSHICHKDGFMGFIWKIINFFQKLFGINPVCECGAAHY